MSTDDLDASLASMSRLDGDLDSLREFAEQYAQVNAGLPRRINADQSNVEQGLAKLVLTLIELIRQLLERQALRRIEGGSLSEDQIERLGETFMKLEDKMEELKQTFGLSDEDLNLNLGPLGDLM
ncbi:MAG: gas vesicle protein K [Ktedonobacterales bacterium]